MATVNDTIRDALYYWPTLYANRAQALDAMFTTSNYVWHDGELVVAYDQAAQEAERPHHTDERTMFCALVDEWLTRQISLRDLHLERVELGMASGPYEWDKLTDLDVEMMRDRAARESAANAHVRDNLDRLTVEPAALDRAPAIYKPAPQYDDGVSGDNIIRIPGNVTDDWLDAAEEFAHVVIAAEKSCYYNAPDHAPRRRESEDAGYEMMKLTCEALGRPVPTLEEYRAKSAASDAEWEKERADRIRADQSTLKRNRELMAEVLDRVAELRAARAAH